MRRSTSDVLTDALELTPEDRERVALVWLDSVGDRVDPAALEAAWRAEIELRIATWRAGRSTAILEPSVSPHYTEVLAIERISTQFVKSKRILGAPVKMVSSFRERPLRDGGLLIPIQPLAKSGRRPRVQDPQGQRRVTRYEKLPRTSIEPSVLMYQGSVLAIPNRNTLVSGLPLMSVICRG